MTRKNIRFGFVVLHYGGEDVTVRCVETIKKNCEKYNTEIVLVDNCSPDGSGARLKKRFTDREHIHVLLTDRNLGFAGGNNTGYKYARKQLACDYICVMNNDVFLQSEEFCPQILDAYTKHHFSVLGPHVTLPGNQENLMQFDMKELAFYEKELKRFHSLNRYYSSKLFPLREAANRVIRRLQSICKKKSAKESPKPQITDYSIYHQVHEHVLLHGCCLIFSPDYVKLFDTAFNPKTFMFREEELLYLRCMEHNLKTVYEPAINILHLEDVSTNTVCRTNRQREIFICGNQEKSLSILIQEMKRNDQTKQ